MLARESISISDAVLPLMQRIHELHLQSPFTCAPMLRNLLNQEWPRISDRNHVRTPEILINDESAHFISSVPGINTVCPRA